MHLTKIQVVVLLFGKLQACNSFILNFLVITELTNLLLDDFFKDAIHKCQSSWRNVVSTAVQVLNIF